MVRVLLDEGILGQKKKIEMQSQHGFTITDIQNKHPKYSTQGHTLTLEFSAQGILFIHGRRHESGNILIKASKGLLSYNKLSYKGSFWITYEKNKWYLINLVELEDYLYCVLRWESWPGWPLEVNKAFAIACRSYVMARMVEARKTKRIYHIKNSNVHQTYKGVHLDEKLRKAIDETSGIIMTHNDQPIEAMFDCCCGGIIPAKLDDVDFIKAPYLARTYPCTFCKPCKIYSWLAEYDIDDFCRLLQKSGHIIDHVRDIKILEWNKGGLPKNILIKGKRHSLKLNGKQMYSALPQVKSFCYGIAKKGNKVEVKGKGYGHHLGICQWGARNMIDKGWNYKGILTFYYPGIQFMKLV